MGKASRRRHNQRSERRHADADSGSALAPFVARPFAGLADETEWVAMREIVPAATAVVPLRRDAPAVTALGVEELPETVTVATVLPMAWPALHRADSEVLIATQAGGPAGSDAGRDLAAALLAALAAEPGSPVAARPAARVDTPRLADLIDGSAGLDVTVHEGFDFWTGDAELDAEARESLARANESVVPTVRLTGARSAYRVRIGGRTYVRWILPEGQDAATDALARLHAAGDATLGDTGRLLGAFRTSGLIVPVWELVDAGSDDADIAAMQPDFDALTTRYAAATAQTGPLTGAERGARAGLLNRQVTLR